MSSGRITEIGRIPRTSRDRRVKRSNNLRAAPSWITPEIVGHILALAIPVEERTVPVRQVPTRGVKPALALIEPQNSFGPPPGEKIRSGEDDPKGEPEAGSQPAMGAPETASPTTFPPVTHSRRAEEDEAATMRAASPPKVLNAPTRECARGRASYNELRAQRAAAQIEADRPLFEIAFKRGIAIVDLAHAVGQHEGTISLHTRQAGFRFGKRKPLAEPLTREILLALADPAVPLPELRSVRLKRESLAKWAKLKREKRADAVAQRKAARARATEERRERRAAEIEKRRIEREADRADAICKKQLKIREAEQPAPRRRAEAAPSREPALPASPQAPAHPSSNARRSATIKRSIERQAMAIIDGDESSKTVGGRVNQAVRAAMNEIQSRRAAEARETDPVERAKTILRRRYAPVCSMIVHGGRPDLFQVGHRKDVTQDELIAWAERVTA